MSDQITYDDKADLQVATNIANINKVTASDMNEIKNVVNSHADDIDVANNNITDLNNNKLDADAVQNEASTDTDKPYSADYLNDKLVSVGTTAPTDGRRVYFAHSKNVLQHSAYDRTLNGVTLKVNDDKSITLTGTASANTNFNIGTNSTLTLKAGTYTFTKGATNVQLLIYYSSASVLCNLPIGTSSQTITINSDTTYENYRVVISIPSGTQTNETIYPMLRLSNTSNTYEPYVDEGIYVDNEQWYSKPKVLWTNPNMQSPFASQTITLNESLNNFKYYEILFMSAQGTPNEYYSTGKILSNKDTKLTRPANYLNNRQVTIASDTTITFGDCVKYQSYNSETTSVTNFAVIPYKILGYKE